MPAVPVSLIPHRRDLLPCLTLAAVCGFMVWLKFSWFPADMDMMPVMGIALGGLLIGGLQCWPAVPLGIALGLLLRDPHPTLWQAATIALPLTLGAMTAAFMIRQLRLPMGPQMSRRQIARLVMVCAGAVLLTHALRIALLQASDEFSFSPAVRISALLRSGLGLLLWLPLIVAWLGQPPRWPDWKTALHFLAMMALTATSAALINLNPGNDPMAWAVMPALVWAALAFRSRGATAAMMVVAFFTLYGFSLGRGPFHQGVILHPWLAQIYLVVLSCTTLLLARLADGSKIAEALRKTASQLSAREAQLNLFISDAPAAIAIFDREMRYLAYSHRFIADYDLPPGVNLLGRSHYEVFPEISARWRVMHQRALAGEEVSGEDDPFVRASGRTDYVRWKLKPWHDTTGDVAGVILFSEVVTQTVENRRAAEEARARYRAVFDQTRVGIARSTLGRRFFEVNGPAAAIAGRSRAEMLTLGPQDITHPDDWPLNAAAAAEMLDGRRQAFEQDERIITGDGGVRWIHLNLSLVRDAHGRPLEFVSIVLDITERLEAQSRLHLARDQLLRVSRLSAMGAMASTLAHELNQPLAAISNFTAAARNLLRQENRMDSDKPAELMERAGKQALRAGEIIRRMRQFTMSGELDLKPEPLDPIIAAACESVHGRKAHAGVRIRQRQQDGAHTVMADRLQLEQVIANLVLNAAEATENQHLREIDVVTSCRDGVVTVAVKDNGPGILPEVAENLFEPFRTTKERGTGLGLPICRTIVEAHGGHIWTETREGAGALIKLTLHQAEKD